MKTLEEYHKTYQARPGDSAEKFARYEEFLKNDPDPGLNGDYHSWYSRLARWMTDPEFLKTLPK